MQTCFDSFLQLHCWKKTPKNIPNITVVVFLEKLPKMIEFYIPEMVCDILYGVITDELKIIELKYNCENVK